MINNSHHSVIKSTPSKLIFGFDLRGHIDYQFAQFTRDLAEIDSNLESQRASARDAAIMATELVRTYNKNYSDNLSRKPTLHNEGTF